MSDKSQARLERALTAMVQGNAGSAGFSPVMNRPPTVQAAMPYRSPDGRLVYDVDAWSREQFDSQVRMGGVLSGVVKPSVSREHQMLHREVFGRLYGIGTERLPDEVIDKTAAAWAPALHDEAAALPEWREMEAMAEGDATLCAIATAKVGDVLNARLRDIPTSTDDLERELEVVESMIKQAKGAAKKRLEKMRAALDKSVAHGNERERVFAETMKANMPDTRTRLRVACENAIAAMSEAKEADGMASALGCGKGGSAAQKVDRVAALSDPRLRRVLALAGRMRHEVASKRKLGGSGREEIHSVEMGADIDRLLPVELSSMGAPMGTELLVGKLADRRALQYAMRGRTKKAKGPILIAIDESGSMAGARDEWAKAVALSLMWVAQQEQRAFGVLHFASRVARADLFGSARVPGPGSLREIVSFFANGGTDISQAMAAALTTIQIGSMPDPRTGESVEWRDGQKADLVIISDGYDTSDVVTVAKSFEEAGVGIFGISIESEFNQELLKRMEHHVQITAQNIAEGLVPATLLNI